MRPNLMFIPTTLGLLLFLSSCATPAQPATIEVSCDDFQQAQSAGTSTAMIARDLKVKVGTPFAVNLCANPSTGFAWETPAIADAAMVQPTDHQTGAPTVSRPGAAIMETWTFKAVSAGTSTVTFAYSRPWTGGEKGVWKLVLKVTAQ